MIYIKQFNLFTYKYLGTINHLLPKLTVVTNCLMEIRQIYILSTTCTSAQLSDGLTEIIRNLQMESVYQDYDTVCRPDTQLLSVKDGVVPLMKVCWHPDPHQRPDFKHDIRLKLKPIQQGLL